MSTSSELIPVLGVTPRAPKQGLLGVVAALTGWTAVVGLMALANGPSAPRVVPEYFPPFANPYSSLDFGSELGKPWARGIDGLGVREDTEAVQVEKVRQASLWARQQDLKKVREKELLEARQERETERRRVERQANRAAYQAEWTIHWCLGAMIWLGGIVVLMTVTAVRHIPVLPARKITLAIIWVAGLMVPGVCALYSTMLGHSVKAGMCVSVAVPEIPPLAMEEGREQVPATLSGQKMPRGLP